MWITEKPEIINLRLLRGIHGGSRNAFTVGNGHHLGGDPRGTCKEPGDRPLTRVPGTGGARGASKAGQLAAPGTARPDKAPHLIHGGPCLILPCRNVSFQDRHAGNRLNTSRDDPVHGGEHRRGPHTAAPRPKAVGAEAADARRRPDPRHPRPALLHDLIAPGREPRVRPAGSVTQAPRAYRLLPASAKRTAYLLAVHKHVDDLCATALGLCMRGGNAGDSAARAHTREGLYLGKRRPRPVHTEKTEIVHMLRRNR